MSMCQGDPTMKRKQLEIIAGTWKNADEEKLQISVILWPPKICLQLCTKVLIEPLFMKHFYGGCVMKMNQ